MNADELGAPHEPRNSGGRRQLRVLAHLPTPGGMTGAPRRLLNLSTALRLEGIEMMIATEPGSDLLATARRQGHRVVAIRSRGILARRRGVLLRGGPIRWAAILLGLVRQYRTLYLTLRRYSPDALWIRGSKGLAFSGLPAVMSRTPIVWDIDYELPSTGKIRYLHRAGLRYASAVVVQYDGASQRIFGEEAANAWHNKIFSVIPGIDLANFDADANRRLRDRTFSSKGTFTLLHVGSVCDRKNQLFSLAVVRRVVAQTERPVRLRVVGGVADPEYADRFRREVTRLGLNDYVEDVGWSDEVSRVMMNADLLLMPSKDEGVPNTVQEAMFRGLPVIASEAGGQPEIVRHGETGWLIPTEQPEHWAQQILTCMSNPAMMKDVAVQASNYAQIRFGLARWGQAYADIIDLVSTRKRSP